MNEIREALESIKATLKRPLENPMQSMESAIRSALHEAETALSSPHPEAREEDEQVQKALSVYRRLIHEIGSTPGLARRFDTLLGSYAVIEKALSRLAAPKPEGQDIKQMVDRFLGWALPEDFNPDCGISYTPVNLITGHRMEPTGTNLLTAEQARKMIEYIVAAPEPRPAEESI